MPASAIQVTAHRSPVLVAFRYPKLGIVTANELHIPVSDPAQPTPTFLKLLSADTDHSLWIPQLAGKTDLIPNHPNSLWIWTRTARVYFRVSARSIAQRSTLRCSCACLWTVLKISLAGSAHSSNPRRRTKTRLPADACLKPLPASTVTLSAARSPTGSSVRT